MYRIIQLYTVDSIYVWGLYCKCNNIPYLGGGHQCKVGTPLHSGPVLKTDCTISHKPLAHPFPKPALFSISHTCTSLTLAHWMSSSFYTVFFTGDYLKS